MNSATKICHQCGEEIKAIARKCPHCQSWQTGIGAAMANPAKATMLALIPMLALFFWTLSWPLSGREKKTDFNNHRAQVTVVNSKITWSKEADGNYISTIGTLKNDSDVKWSPLHLEVQYFNPAGTMIDTQAEKDYELILLPHSEHAFRLRQKADKPESEYATHKIFVRDADDADRWP